MFYFKKTSIVAMLAAGCFMSTAAEKKDADLIGYWGFNEGKGETTKDLSNNGNPGKIFNGKWVANGITGKALEFNGVNTFVNLGKSKLFDISKDYTISLWLKIGDIKKKGFTLINKRYWNKGWQLYIYKSFIALSSRELRKKNSSKKPPVYYRKFSYGKLKADPILGDIFYNIVLTSKTEGENTIITFYINGKKGKSFSYPDGKLIVNNSSLTLGHYASAEAHYFSGIMDEVKLYKRALTAEEIKKAYDELND